MNAYQETWKDIADFNGIYQVSSFGRVRAIERIAEYKRWGGGKSKIIKGKIFQPTLNRLGYLVVNPTLNGRNKSKTVHSLVASAFLEKPSYKVEVNHKNGIKSDNRVENLEWVTHQENILHSYAVLKRKKYLGKEHWNSKAVYQYSLSGQFIAKYNCVNDVERNGFNRISVLNAANKKQKKANGFIWSYTKLSNVDFVNKSIYPKTNRVIIQKNGNCPIAKYPSLQTAIDVSGYGRKYIENSAKGITKSYRSVRFEYLDNNQIAQCV